jgi:hypothetical protein
MSTQRPDVIPLIGGPYDGAVLPVHGPPAPERAFPWPRLDPGGSLHLHPHVYLLDSVLVRRPAPGGASTNDPVTIVPLWCYNYAPERS